MIGMSSDLVLLESDDDRMAVLREVFLENPELNSFLSRQAREKCLRLIKVLKRNFIMPETCNIEHPFPLVYTEYNRRLRLRNTMDFDDLLYYAYRILTENERVVQMYNSFYRYIVVDESQDLNFAQYNVIKALCGKEFRNIMLAGDENQSIYGFVGSDSSYMAKSFVEDFSPKVFTLNENYRSAKKIVEFANRLNHSDSIANYVYDGELKAYAFADEHAEALFLVNKIEQLKRDGHPDIEGPVTEEKIAVIARNRYVFSSLEEELKRREIPFYYKRTGKGIDNESDFMKVFDLSIRIMINPKDYIHFNRLKAMIGCEDIVLKNEETGFQMIEKILTNSKYEEIIHVLKQVDNADGLRFNEVLKGLKELLPGFEDNERYLISLDINQWEKHWNKYCAIVPRERRTLSTFRNLISLGKTSMPERNTGISLLTAHMSKGTQYDIVFIIGLCEGVFPDYRAVRGDEQQQNQELNNMYVTVTRAKRLCYMTYPRSRKMPWGDIKSQQPSSYIKDIPLCIL